MNTQPRMPTPGPEGSQQPGVPPSTLQSKTSEVFKDNKPPLPGAGVGGDAATGGVGMQPQLQSTIPKVYPIPVPRYNPKVFEIATILSFSPLACGLQRCYVDQPKKGILYCLTLGGCGCAQCYDYYNRDTILAEAEQKWWNGHPRRPMFYLAPIQTMGENSVKQPPANVPYGTQDPTVAQPAPATDQPYGAAATAGTAAAVTSQVQPQPSPVPPQPQSQPLPQSRPPSRPVSMAAAKQSPAVSRSALEHRAASEGGGGPTPSVSAPQLPTAVTEAPPVQPTM